MGLLFILLLIAIPVIILAVIFWPVIMGYVTWEVFKSELHKKIQ
jgi:hypothetical protein